MTPLVAKALVVGGWLLLFLVAERLWPAEPRRGGWRRIARNAALWAINSVASPLIVLPLSAFAAAHPLWQRPDWASGSMVMLAADLLLLDFLIYWWHRANHELGFLWRFHSVHHLDRFLDASSAVRFHLGEVLLSAAVRTTVILLLAIAFSTVLLFEVLLLLAAIFHHSNLRLPPVIERHLAALVITPSLHWVHHHARRRDTDSTYGTILSVWDRLFRSRTGTRRYAGMEIGIEGQPGDAPLPRLLAWPLRAEPRPD